MILETIEKLNENQYKKLLIFSIVLSLIILIPYEIQITHQLETKNSNPRELNGYEIKAFLERLTTNELSIKEVNKKEIIQREIKLISEEFPNETFIVGNLADDYYILQENYWGENIKEFVSIQDYKLDSENKSDIISIEFRSPFIQRNERREIWISGGMGKPINDTTSYKSIKYAISFDENLDLDGFKLVKEYDVLRVWEKELISFF